MFPVSQPFVGLGVIEESPGQVCRGLNRFLEWLASREDFAPEGSSPCVLPVIFMTAKLLVSDTGLGTADQRSRELREAVELKERE
jgi:hypothetical protein